MKAKAASKQRRTPTKKAPPPAATPVLTFELADVPPAYLAGFDQRWDDTPLRFYIARPDTTLFDGLLDAVPELDHHLATEAVAELERVFAEAIHLVAPRLALTPDGGMWRTSMCAFVGLFDAADAWLVEQGVELLPFPELDTHREPEAETLEAALERLGRREATPARVRKREAALEASLARLALARRWYEAHFGLQLPRHLAVFHALTQSLTPKEKRGLDEVGFHPFGVTARLDLGDASPRVSDGHDPRLVARYRRDPPEMVTVASGDSDGEHFGLWYDDAGAPPTAIACNYARDSAETELVGATLLDVLAQRVVERLEDDDEATDVLALAEAVRWFLPHDEAARAEEEITPRTDRATIVGAPAPAFDLESPWLRDPHERAALYRKGIATKRGRSRAVDRLVAEAHDELNAGRPTLAWILGHELHWLDADGYREDALALLLGAYAARGEAPFARILEVHHARRDLRAVPHLHA